MAALELLATEDGLLLYYPCDEKEGTVLHDAGPFHKDGSLNAVTNGEERGVEIICKKYGEWVPTVNKDGIQRKGIVLGSDSALAEGERPIVLDRDKDYAIDYAGGRIKSLDGGRVELGKPFTIDFKFSNLGPTWVAGKRGGGVRLDGADDFLTLGILSLTNSPSAMTIELWANLAKDCGTGATVFGTGSEDTSFGMFVFDTELAFSYALLCNALVLHVIDHPLACDKWHHLAVTSDERGLAVYLDAKEVVRYTGRWKQDPSLRICIGTGLKPAFLSGVVDEIKIYNRAKTVEEIAKDAAP